MPVTPLTFEENVVVLFVPATESGWGISDPEAPTDAELTDTDVVDLSSYIQKNGGITLPSTRNAVDTASIDRRHNSEAPGSEGGPLELVLKRQNRDGDTEAFDLFGGGDVSGDIVIGYDGSADSADDVVDVFRGTASRPVRNSPAGDEEQRIAVTHRVDSEYQAVDVVSGA